MNNLSWSVLANLLYNSMSWANAKAYILANYIGTGTDEQTVAAAEMEANKTGGANLVAVGAVAPGSRTQASAPWYVQGAPFEAALPSTAGSTVPNWMGSQGNVLTVGAAGLEFDAASAGGVTSFGAFGSAPSANGATVAGSVATLQPADNTHPGGLSILAQTIKGVKTFTDAINVNGIAFLGIAAGETQGALWMGPTAFATPGDTNFAVQVYNSQGYFNSPSTQVHLTVGGADVATFSSASAQVDFTPLVGGGHGTQIKVKSANGTTYILEVNNSGVLTVT